MLTSGANQRLATVCPGRDVFDNPGRDSATFRGVDPCVLHGRGSHGTSPRRLRIPLRQPHHQLLLDDSLLVLPLLGRHKAGINGFEAIADVLADAPHCNVLQSAAVV